MPPTLKPDISLNATTHSHEGAKLIMNVKIPNDPTERAMALVLPMRSLISPQVKPPAVHPAMYKELMIALILASPEGSTVPERSFTTTGRYTDIKVEISPANTFDKKQTAKDSQRKVPIFSVLTREEAVVPMLVSIASII
jgi:hypothetical protein